MAFPPLWGVGRAYLRSLSTMSGEAVSMTSMSQAATLVSRLTYSYFKHNFIVNLAE